jgi:prepilin-type processing-associated H-X9-DG protein
LSPPFEKQVFGPQRNNDEKEHLMNRRRNRASLKCTFIRYSVTVMLIVIGALTPGQSQAQEREKQIALLSPSVGLAAGQTAHVNVVNFVFADGSVRSRDPIIARIQILDTEGEVIAESDEIRVAPNQTRFWDVPREQLPSSEPTGRIQVRVRILVTTLSPDVNPPLASLEIFDSATGVIASVTNVFSAAPFRF